MAKRRKTSPDPTFWEKKDFEAIAWCHNNKITMCVIPGSMCDRRGDFYIEIKVKDKVSYSPPYTKDQASLKQKEFYHYYKNKYDKNI
tara:strand:- start:1488 stop:1748 length:261 start_codon:yes stop_codon:yes gene_type:complete